MFFFFILNFFSLYYTRESIWEESNMANRGAKKQNMNSFRVKERQQEVAYYTLDQSANVNTR